jgi:hypothetical protein
MTKHRLYVRIAAKIKVIRSPKLWSSIGSSRDTKLGTKLKLNWKLELNRKLGIKLATADTVTDAGAVTALEVVDRDFSSTVAALHSERARTARNIGAVAALKVCTSSRN